MFRDNGMSILLSNCVTFGPFVCNDNNGRMFYLRMFQNTRTTPSRRKELASEERDYCRQKWSLHFFLNSTGFPADGALLETFANPLVNLIRKVCWLWCSFLFFVNHSQLAKFNDFVCFGLEFPAIGRPFLANGKYITSNI